MTDGDDVPHRVVVVGSINIDVLVTTTRHPRPGETVAGRGVETGFGGKGLNQAIAAARAGSPVVMVGAVGDDDEGRNVMNFLAAAGVDVTGVGAAPATATGHAIVTVDDAGENAIVVIAGANGTLTAADVARSLPMLEAADVVVLQNEIAADANREAARLAASAGATVIWNAAPATPENAHLPEGTHVLVVNESELHVVAAAAGITMRADHEPGQVAKVVAETLHVTVVLTLGGDGSVLIDGPRIDTVPAEAVDVVDTTAAGDTYIGYLANRLREPNVGVGDLIIAGRAAALTVTRRGAASSIPLHAEVMARTWG